MSSVKEIVNHQTAMRGDPEEVCVEYTRELFRHLYRVWQTIKAHYGYDAGKDLYVNATWGGPEAAEDFKETLRSQKLEVKDIPSLARAVKASYAGWAISLREIEVRADQAVLEGYFCPNPMFGPRIGDRYLDRAEFAYVDGWLGTTALFNQVYLEVTGLKDQLEFSMEAAYCMGYGCCRFVVRRKN